MVENVAALFCIPSDAVHLEEALTHPSYANEQKEKRHNQRLEFLGDAVLQLCCSQALWTRYPDADEGELTRRRAQLVNTEALAEFARRSGVAQALRLGRGAEASGLRDNQSVLADAVESLLAAAYLDGGLQAATRACERIFGQLSKEHDSDDPKTELQQKVQGDGLSSPTYQVIESGGPDHERWFRVAVFVEGRQLADGKGRSKRQAEREAARHALTVLSEASSEGKVE